MDLGVDGANVVYTAQQTSCTPGECWAPIVVISTVAVLDDAVGRAQCLHGLLDGPKHSVRDR